MIESRRLGAVTVFQVHGRLSRESGLRPAIRAAFDEGSDTVVLNLEDVSGIDSSGLGELLRCESSALDHGGRVVICSPSAKANAVARPMPIPPPVINTTRFVIWASSA